MISIISGETRQTNTFGFSKILYNRLRTADINAGSDTAAVCIGKRWEAVECLKYIRGPRAFPLDTRYWLGYSSLHPAAFTLSSVPAQANRTHFVLVSTQLNIKHIYVAVDKEMSLCWFCSLEFVSPALTKTLATLLYVQRSQCTIWTTGNLAHMKLWFFYVNMRTIKTKITAICATATKLLLEQLWLWFFVIFDILSYFLYF